MARTTNDQPTFEPHVLGRDKETRKIIRVFLRALTPGENDDLRDRIHKASRKLKSLRNEIQHQTVGEWERKLKALAIEKASLGLEGSENYEQRVLGQANQQSFVTASGLTLNDDNVAELPRVWSQGLKEWMFTHDPVLLDSVCQAIDEKSAFEEAEEDEETASFR